MIEEENNVSNKETLELGLTVGCTIRDARRKTKKQIKTISNELKISAKYLEGIENDDYSKFPGDAYMTGFVKNYANYLDLDGDELSQQLIKEQFGKSRSHVFNKMDQKIEPVKKAPKTSLSDKFIHAEDGDFNNLGLVVLAVVVLLIVVIFSLFNKSSDTLEVDTQAIEEIREGYIVREDISEENFMLDMENDIVEEQSELYELEEAIIKEDKSFAFEKDIEIDYEIYGEEYRRTSILTINVIEDSWVEIFDRENQRTLFTKVFAENDKIIIPNREGIILNTGNAGGLELMLHGKKLKPVGPRGTVSGYISLDEKYLRRQKYKPTTKEKDLIDLNKYRLN